MVEIGQGPLYFNLAWALQIFGGYFQLFGAQWDIFGVGVRFKNVCGSTHVLKQLFGVSFKNVFGGLYV